MRPITHIIVHHSLTADSQTVSWGAIENYHKTVEGWQDIGYNAGVELVGDAYYALIGRDINIDAAAVKEGHMNHVGLHVCCIGNYDLLPPTTGMIDCLIRRVIKPWMEQYNVPIENVKAHRDYAPYKSCPGTMFDMDHLRTLLK